MHPPDATHPQVSFAREKGEVDEARETLERCLEEYPDSQEVVSQALSYYDAVGEDDGSLEILKEAVKSSPENSDYRVGLVVRPRNPPLLTVEAVALHLGLNFYLRAVAALPDFRQGAVHLFRRLCAAILQKSHRYLGFGFPSL